MRKLRDCEFCGAEAAGAFEVVPAELTPSGDGPRRAVLCASCEARLEDLVEPLLARARADATGAAGPRAGRDEPGTVGRGTNDASDGNVGADDSADGDAGADVPGDDGAASARDAGDGPRGSDASVAFEADDADRPGGAEGGDGSDRPDGAEDGSDRADASGGASDRPRAYGKVLRLVRNREFPMERAAVESLAAGAYDLTDREARRAIDRAIEDGELAEDGDQLRRP